MGNWSLWVLSVEENVKGRLNLACCLDQRCRKLVTFITVDDRDPASSNRYYTITIPTV